MGARVGDVDRAARRAWIAVTFVVALGCTAQDAERCAGYCDACGVGYCVAGGGSGWCSADGARPCILASEGDCDALRRCISGPDIDGGTDAGIDTGP